MDDDFDEVVQALIATGYPNTVALVFRQQEDFDNVLKHATGLLAHGTASFDTSKVEKLISASTDDPWAFDATKLGAIQVQRMHPLLSKQTADWTASAFAGDMRRPAKSGPQPNFAKQMVKSMVHVLVELAEEKGLTRMRHNTTKSEKSAYDAVVAALADADMHISFDQVAAWDKECRADTNQKKLKRFFPTENF